ncbi:MAG: cation-transporting P-type ATPase [Patescibacteria group bacterium]|nr:cation-transporting P-type ATPase [Patescibacteria group bacterium]
MGFFFELRTEKTLQKLKELLKPKAKVIRNGELLEIESSDLVPGDIILVEEGDIVPADIRFFEVENLKVDESILTGESLPVEKNISVFPQETPIPEQKNIGFMGSYVVEGRGRGIVFATALNTYIGGIYKKFQKIQTTTPHFEKLSRDLILRMFLIALSSASIILFFSFQRDYFLADTLLFVLSAFISSIPEGLPIIISIVLVLSAYNLSKKNVLVRNLQATENLSIVNLLLSDKTGTLTENTMTVRKIFVNKEEIEITGEGLNLEGKFLVNNKEFNILENYPLIKILNICSIVSEAELLKDHILKFKGNARDIALLVMVEKSGINRETILNREKIIKREPFSRIKKYKKVIVEHEKVESYYIGAFESIINISKFILLQEGIFNFENKKYILEKALNYAQNGFSVLAVAFNIGESEENLIFVGLIALYDPPKRGVKETIQKLKKAGIETKILTGDHKETAIYIAKEIGFDNLTTLYQSEIENLDEEELKRKIAKTSIFARITPETKLKILDLYQKLGYSVAYIGDGVNDVLSLKKAEVGVCMGERGSEIAKQASDIILMDDHIESLSRSVSEGRKIFNNLRRVVFFLITTNVAESLTIITALILGYPFILKPTHILFLNFVTDTLVGTTLAFEREHGYELQSKPRKTNESLINLNLIPFLLMMSTIMTILTVMIFSTEFLYDLEKARTYAFLVMSFTQLYNAINLRSLNSNIFKLSFKFNPYIVFGLTFSLLLQYLVIFNPTLRGLLGFSKITLIEFLVVLILSSLVFFASEFYKFIRNRLKK